MNAPVCAGCGRHPKDIPEYIERMMAEGFASPDEAVRQEEGTYNPDTDRFWCTECYIRVGMPLGKAP